ncbi:MAG: hypothetical protein ACR2HC_05115 [Thermoleophilaceae bacterium]
MTTAVPGTSYAAPTQAENVRVPDLGADATASTTRALNNQAAGLRDTVSLLNQDVEALHHETTEIDLSDRAAEINRSRTLVAMLEELADHGMSWSDIAKTVAVTPAAVRKWRRGEPAQGPTRMAVAQLLALLGLLEQAAIAEPVAWLISPVTPEALVTMLDLLRAGRPQLILDLAYARKHATQVLDEFDPQWRRTRGRRFQVEVGQDGEPTLAPYVG